MHHPLIAVLGLGVRRITLSASALTFRNKTSAKKKKTAAEALAAGAFAYHPEEEMIDARAVAVHSYPLKTAPPRDDEAFGVEQFGRLVLIETGKLAEAVGAMEEACKP